MADSWQRAALAHRIAGCVHLMLAERGMTAAELKAKIGQFPTPRCQPETIEAVLVASDGDKVTCSDLSDIAWALRFEWDFQISKMVEPSAESGPATLGEED